jgi:hypothetical protein
MSTRLPFVWAATVSALTLLACAKGSSSTLGTGGDEGGAGGEGGDGGAGNAGNQGGSGNTGNQGGSGNAGNQGGSGNTGNQGGSGNAGGGGSGNAGNQGGSGGGCAPPKHECGGICTPNTPATGCYQSVSCNPCPPAPSFGTSVCTMDGLCDFTCQQPYVKQGSACGCASECCSSADCNGGTCQNGTCTDPPPPPCDMATCTSDCFLMCFPGFGLGICDPITNTCLCQCG